MGAKAELRDGEELALLFDVKAHEWGDGATITLSPVALNGKVRLFTEGAFEDLRCQGMISRDWDYAYGVSLAYGKPYTVDLGRAESMVKTLRGIQAKLDKLEVKFGHTDFPGYAARLCDSMGINKVVTHVTASGKRLQWEDMRTGDMQDLTTWIRYAIAEFGKKEQ